MRLKLLSSQRGSIEAIVLVVALVVTLGAASWWVYAQRMSNASEVSQEATITNGIDADESDIKAVEGSEEEAIPESTGVE